MLGGDPVGHGVVDAWFLARLEGLFDGGAVPTGRNPPDLDTGWPSGPTVGALRFLWSV